MRFEIAGANRETGKPVSMMVEATSPEDAQAQANELGVIVSGVRPVGPTAPQGPSCPVCRGSKISRARIYRLSGAVVVIGWIILVPSILGMIGNGFLLLAPVLGIASDPASMLNDQYRQDLTDAGVDNAMIERVLDGVILSEVDAAQIPDDQRIAIRKVEADRTESIASCACCAFGLFGTGVIGIVASFVSGILGWLLVMKKRVFRCNRCGAIVANA